MSADPDLRGLHRPHEPDPAFVDALEQRLRAMLTSTTGDGPVIEEPPAVEDGAAVDLYAQEPAARLDRGPWVRRAVLGVAAALVLLAGIAVIVRREERAAIEPITPVRAANGWVAQQFGNEIWLVQEGEADRAVDYEVDDVGEGGAEVCPAFSPDGARLMIGEGPYGELDGEVDGALDVVNIAADGTFSLQTAIPIEGIVGIPCAIWAPDGRWAAFGGGGSVWVVDTETGDVRQLAGYDPTDLEWRPGTDELAITGSVVGGNAPITIYTVSTGEITTFDDVEAAELTWSPDGTTIAYTQAVSGTTGTTSAISLIDADGTNPRPLTTGDFVADHGIGVVWSPLGDQIAYQRNRTDCTGDACFELSEIVLVTATDTDPDTPIGTERAVPPVVNSLDIAQFQELYNHAPPFRSQDWYADSVTWSPDGTELLYSAGSAGLLAVPVDPDRPAVVLSGDVLIGATDELATSPWIPLQQWQPIR